MNAGYCPECQKFLHRKVWRIFPDGFDCCSECIARLGLKPRFKTLKAKPDKPKRVRVRPCKTGKVTTEELVLQILKEKPVMTSNEILERLLELNAPSKSYGHLVKSLRLIAQAGKILMVAGYKGSDPNSYALPENSSLLFQERSRSPAKAVVYSHLSFQKPTRIVQILKDLQSKGVPKATAYMVINQGIQSGEILKEYISPGRFNVRLSPRIGVDPLAVNAACKNEVW